MKYRVMLIALLLVSGSARSQFVLDSLPKFFEDVSHTDTTRLSALLDSCEALITANPGRVLEFAREAIRLAQHMGEDHRRARAIYYLGRAHLLLNEYNAALKVLRQGLEFTEQTGDSAARADILNAIGAVYSYTGNYAEALEYFLHALQIWEEMGDSALIAKSLNNIGVMYSYLDNHQKALAVHRRSMRIREA
ncbi:MAG: tetratricopeptide repeat protein, partial [Calditrichaeota bacterium]